MHIEFEKPLINGVGVMFFFQKTQSARSQNHHLNEKRYADELLSAVLFILILLP